MLNEGLERLGDINSYRGETFLYSGLESIELPSTLRVLANGVFHGCPHLKNIALPDGLEHIGSNCFSRTGLEEFIAPHGLKTIDEQAF